MNYEELRERERELAKALIEVREQLEKMDEEKALELLQIAINLPEFGFREIDFISTKRWYHSSYLLPKESGISLTEL